MSDMSGHDATERDTLHTLTLRDLEALVAAAGVLISRRQLMRHCEAGTFDAQKLPATNNVLEWFIAPAHASPLSSGAIAWYMSANKELGHDASDAGRSVA
jgi:hypothetical protein